MSLDFPAFIAHFQIDSIIGQGSSGIVYKAFDQRLSRWVAIKQLYAYQTADIIDEAKMLAGLNHPNVVSVFDVIVPSTNDGQALVMEFLAGKTLKQRLIDNEKMSLQQVLILTADIAKGLGAIHNMGIVHRDLKAENIFLDSDNLPKIGDFGIASTSDKQDTSAMLGSSLSLSPEQVLSEPIDYRSDLFSLGLLLYQMLQGRHPFDQGDGQQALLERLVAKKAPALNCDNLLLQQLIDRLLAKDPQKRFESAGGVVAKIHQILALESANINDPTLSVNNPLISGFNNRRARRTKFIISGFAASIIVSIALWFGFSSPPQYIAVLKPIADFSQTDSRNPLIEATIYDASVQTISQMNQYKLVAGHEVDNVVHSADNIAKILSLTAANEVLLTRLSCSDHQCVTTMSRWQGTPAILINQTTSRIPVEQLLFVSDYIQQHLLSFYQDNAQLKKPSSLISDSDYQQFVQLKHGLASKALSLGSYIDQLEALNRNNCSYGQLCHELVNAYIKKFGFERDHHWLNRAKQLIAKAALSDNNHFYLFAQAQIALVEQDFDQADIFLSQLEEKNVSDDSLLSLRARWFFAQGFDVKGLKLMQQLVTRRPAAAYRYNYALMLYIGGEFERSLSQINALLSDVSDYVPALELSADIALNQGKWDYVTNRYQQLLDMGVDDNPTTQSNMGFAFLMQNKPKQTLHHFKQAASMAPNNPGVVFNLAEGYLLNQQTQLAKSHYQRVLTLLEKSDNKSKTDLLTLAQTYANLDQPEQAIAQLKKVHQLNASDPLDLYSIAIVYLLLQEHDIALDYLRQALDAGLSNRWLALPWFAPLHQHQSFKQLQTHETKS